MSSTLHLHQRSLPDFDTRRALTHSGLVVHRASIADAGAHDALLLHSFLLVGGRATSERKLQKFDSFLVLEHVTLLQILQHISVALDQDL